MSVPLSDCVTAFDILRSVVRGDGWGAGKIKEKRYFFELGAGGDGGRRDAIVETKVEGMGCGKEGKRERGS